MSLIVRVTVEHPGPGRFHPDSFDEYLQAHIHLAGLDPTWTHTLIDATVAEDGGSAELVVQADSPVVPVVDGFRVVNRTPPVRVRLLDEAGEPIGEGIHPSPLGEGQHVAYGNQRYRVAAVDWPGRHPETGVCAGDIDWQHATLAPTAEPSPFPKLAP